MSARHDQHGDVQAIRVISAAGRMVRVGVAVYIVDGVMIDTGFSGARHHVIDAVARHGVRGAIVTHWHEDHAGNVEVLARLGVPIALRPDTEAILRRRPQIALYRRLIWRRPPRLTAEIRPFTDHGLDLVYTPGHSSDHQVVFDRETGTLFSGDLWLGTRARILHAAEDPHQIIESLRIAAALNPERMFDAHRGPVSNPVRSLLAKAEWMATTIGEIERRIAEGWNDERIVKDILGGEEFAARISHGEYARANFVRAVRKGRG